MSSAYRRIRQSENSKLVSLTHVLATVVWPIVAVLIGIVSLYHAVTV